MLLDLLLGFAADAAVAGAQSRRVPKALRIVLTMLIALFMLTVGGFMLLCARHCGAAGLWGIGCIVFGIFGVFHSRGLA